MLVENILKQKSKIHWLQCGDGNNRFFHASLKSRSKSDILVLQDAAGNKLVEGAAIEREITSLYKQLLGSAVETCTAVDLSIVGKGPVLSIQQRRKLVTPVTTAEILSTLNSIGDDKAPGLDGFSSKFFQKAWGVIGSELVAAIQDFFRTDKLLKCLNTTLITLIPKSSNVSTIKQYRPIACCTVIYKIISKVLTSRMGDVMSSLISGEQAAFVPGRFIHDNTILAQEIIRGYRRKGILARCMIKMDLQKAYDSVQWSFVEQLLRAYRFPSIFVDWILAGLTTVAYQININGGFTAPFAGKNLGKGTPSPLFYLFFACSTSAECCTL